MAHRPQEWRERDRDSDHHEWNGQVEEGHRFAGLRPEALSRPSFL
jgi:hypothetical protein